MSKLLTEQKALKQLGIQDFSQLPKGKLNQLTSLLPVMSPEVAKKALDQFPNYTSTIVEIMHIYQQTIDKMLESDAEGSQYVREISNRILTALEKRVEKDDLTHEEEQYYYEQMMLVAKRATDFEMAKMENRNAMFTFFGGLGAFLVVFLGTVLGIHLSSNQKEDQSNTLYSMKEITDNNSENDDKESIGDNE